LWDNEIGYRDKIAGKGLCRVMQRKVLIIQIKKNPPASSGGVSFRGAQKNKNFLRGIPIKGFPLGREQEMAFSP
jgi:hypothetical protein